jgi:tRNA-dihydrouridine synthase
MTWREAAQAALDAGVSAITIHPRTRAQGYEGHSDWGIMKELVELVAGRVPVFGSGDLFKPEDARLMLAQTGADAVMFARCAMGNPFIFRDATDLLTKGSYEPVPPEEKKDFEFEGWINCQPMLTEEQAELCRKAEEAGYDKIAY